jgi:hypothetical protein
MTDDELRALVRDAIARHLGSAPGPGPGSGPGRVTQEARPDPPWRAHPSFGKFLVMRGDEQGGACLIEPTVACNHCGFCQSYGH